MIILFGLYLVMDCLSKALQKYKIVSMLTKIDAARSIQKQEGWVIFGYFADKQYNRYVR
jgi:hypothetical protein